MLATAFSSFCFRLKTVAELADLERATMAKAAKHRKRKAAPATTAAAHAQAAAKRAARGEKQAYQAAKNAAGRVAKAYSRKLSASGTQGAEARSRPSAEADVEAAALAAYLKHTTHG